MTTIAPPAPRALAALPDGRAAATDSAPWRPAVRAVWAREWSLALARPGDAWVQGLFFAAVAALPALGTNPTPSTLALLAPGVVWVAALLAVLLASARCFHDDLQGGWLDQWLLCGVPLALLAAARQAAQWLLAVTPVLLLAPLVALQYGLSMAAFAVLMLTLLPGTLVLVQLASVAAALTAGLRQSGLLVVGLTLPLGAPVLVFGSLAVRAAQVGDSAAPHMYLLAALACATTAATPWLVASALRIGVEA